MLKNKILEILRRKYFILMKYWLLLFYCAAIIFLELTYTLWCFKRIGADFAFPVLFSLSAAAILYILSSLFNPKWNRRAAIILITLLSICYSVQLVYFSIFQTPLSLYSITGAKDVLQFRDTIFSSVVKNLPALLLLILPPAYLFAAAKSYSYKSLNQPLLFTSLLVGTISYGTSLACVNMTCNRAASQYALYYNASCPKLSVLKLGVLTTMRLDLDRLVFGSVDPHSFLILSASNSLSRDRSSLTSVISGDAIYTFSPMEVTKRMASGSENGQNCTEATFFRGFNTMDIDFDALFEKEQDKAYREMHKYFSRVSPTEKNGYTGLFKDHNLILITAEAFAPYAISPELTPTLYQMSTEGFVFSNFYNPIWGVSTSDGEYVACTGLVPKSGVWSFAASGKNTMPFVMGNQLKKLGYTTKAYHNHSYTYYKRDISHPNMGYDYKGVGNGLDIKITWPESDLEMIHATVDEFINFQPFHTYYMTVSGHLEYNFGGNFIARKNKEAVAHLDYSEPCRAYLACNLELEYAMTALLEKLEAAGVADKTVIAISPDHYPYGLKKESIDELAGHKVEENFELHKSTFILWKKGMEPVLIDKPCSSLDIIPTLSNLFGLVYDSRLLMGRDILSDAPALVIFSNLSWITDVARFNSTANTISYLDPAKEDKDYEKAVNREVRDKFKYSAKILEKDYYAKILPSVRK